MRAFEPLTPTPSTASLTPVLGLFAAEGGYVAELGGEASVSRLLTVVLNFDAPARQPMLLRLLVGGLRHVIERRQVITSATAPDRLPIFFKDYPPSSVNVVVVLPDAAKLQAAEVDGALATLRALPNLQVQLVVGVAESPWAWAGLSSVEHFVETGRSRLEWASASVYWILATAMAPKALLEVDAEEMRSFFGTAANPSFLVHAQWEPAAGSVHLHGDFDASELLHASASMVTSLMAEATGRSTRGIASEWAALCAPDAVVAANVATECFDVSPDGFKAPGRLVALCKARRAA
ncbi:hypothetical protein [Variovorax guangxiensis]|uniref:Uncharacterized protein n=1 Tax=Variovorax guangxiensis TaxID=1775474 RepID=A0A502DH85_9BURK|nr:hypothetical protein [Variovorax guangxiensis]TPG23456.1 hypothetical protein EAH82_20545 [Variovorax guangxiensis]TPG24085.1 hypothetical protein EAH83_06175 [Variovorax ginsengisoli]